MDNSHRNSINLLDWFKWLSFTDGLLNMYIGFVSVPALYEDTMWSDWRTSPPLTSRTNELAGTLVFLSIASLSEDTLKQIE